MIIIRDNNPVIDAREELKRSGAIEVIYELKDILQTTPKDGYASLLEYYCDKYNIEIIE